MPGKSLVTIKISKKQGEIERAEKEIVNIDANI